MGSFREPRVVRLALDVLAFCEKVGALLGRRVPDLNGQLQDAAASLVANAGEALDDRSPGDQRKFFGYALRSAGECQRLLRGAERVGALSPRQLEEGLRLIVAVKMDLGRLYQWASGRARRR